MGKVRGTSLICGQQSAMTSSENNTGQKMGKGHRNTETQNLFIPWYNSPLEEKSIAEQGIEPGVSISVKLRYNLAKEPGEYSIIIIIIIN